MVIHDGDVDRSAGSAQIIGTRKLQANFVVLLDHSPSFDKMLTPKEHFMFQFVVKLSNEDGCR